MRSNLAGTIIILTFVTALGGCYTQLSTVRTDEGAEYGDETVYQDTVVTDDDEEYSESYPPNYHLMFGFYLPFHHRVSWWDPWYWDSYYYYDPFYCMPYYPPVYYGYWVPIYPVWWFPHHYSKPYSGHYYGGGKEHGTTRTFGNTRGSVGIGGGRGSVGRPVTVSGRPEIPRAPTGSVEPRELTKPRIEKRKPKTEKRSPAVGTRRSESSDPKVSSSPSKNEGTGSDRGGTKRISQSPPRSSVPGSSSSGRSDSSGSGGARGGGSRSRPR